MKENLNAHTPHRDKHTYASSLTHMQSEGGLEKERERGGVMEKGRNNHFNQHIWFNTLNRKGRTFASFFIDSALCVSQKNVFVSSTSHFPTHLLQLFSYFSQFFHNLFTKIKSQITLFWKSPLTRTHFELHPQFFFLLRSFVCVVSNNKKFHNSSISWSHLHTSKNRKHTGEH